MSNWVSSGEGMMWVDGFDSVKQCTFPLVAVPGAQYYRPDIGIMVPFPPIVTASLTTNAMVEVDVEVG